MGESKNKQFDAIRLQDQAVRRDFSVALRNRFNVLQDEALMTIDDFNEAITKTAEETIGYKKKVKSEWISTETWTIIENRNLTKKKTTLHHDSTSRLKERYNTQYKDIDKQVKKSARRDKRRYAEELAEEAEAAVQRKDLKTVYKITRKLRGDHNTNQDMQLKHLMEQTSLKKGQS